MFSNSMSKIIKLCMLSLLWSEVLSSSSESIPVGVAPAPLDDTLDANDLSPAQLGELQNFRVKRYSHNSVLDREYRQSKKPASCTPEFQKMSGHTMCMRDNPYLKKSGLKRGAAGFIVREHNRYRGSVQPPATDLPKMVWNAKLARVAQKWAKQCVLAHDEVRYVPEFGDQFIGQNVAAGHPGWKAAMKAWYDEIHLYRYGQDPMSYIGENYTRIIGHFTQIVHNATVLVGCGYAICPNTKYTRYYVCNYLAGQSQLTYPFTKGARCSECPGRCKKGVCDCGGKFCRNRGRLNLKTCQCECTDLYQGNTCSQTVCPPRDASHCGEKWKKSLCKKYVNVPVECPYMCGRCTAKDKKKYEMVPLGKGIKVNGKDFFRSNNDCTFFGHRPSKALCKTYGSHGQDKQYACAASGGKFTCEDCHNFFNVPTEYCPVMCGLCDAPCGGKQCSNNGVLNPKTCKCKCVPPFSGANCKQVKCPKSDRRDCGRLPKGACKKFYNVPEICPYKCGICKAKGW